MKPQLRFSKQAEKYNHSAWFQRKIAAELASKIAAEEISASAKLLDIGCGTGFLAQILQQQKIAGEIIQLDISEAMIKQTKSAFTKAKSVVADMHALPFAEKTFSLLLSSCALQWCYNIPKLFLDLKNITSPGGKWLFATVLEESHPEWITSMQATNIFLTREKLPNFNDYKKALQEIAPTAEIYQREYVELYPSFSAFLRDLKNIGASKNIKPEKSLTKTDLRELEKYYQQNFSGGENIQATWKIAWISAGF